MRDDTLLYAFRESGRRAGRLTLRVRPRPGGGTVCDATGEIGPFGSRVSATVDGEGTMLRARWQEPNGAIRELERRPDGFHRLDSGAGILTLDCPLVTPLDLLGWPGARLRLGQEYRWLSFDRDGIPTVDPLFVREQKPAGRALRLTLEWRSRRFGTRTGTVDFDPGGTAHYGAAVAVGPPWIDRVQRAVGPARVLPNGEERILWRDGAMTRNRILDQNLGNRELVFVAGGRAPYGRQQVGVDLAPLTFELGAKPTLRAKIRDAFDWSLDPVDAGRIDLPSPRVWSPAHLLAPSLWDAAAADLAVGATAEGALLLLRPTPVPFTLERLPDTGSARNFRFSAEGLSFVLTVAQRVLTRLQGRGVEIVADPA